MDGLKDLFPVKDLEISPVAWSLERKSVLLVEIILIINK